MSGWTTTLLCHFLYTRFGLSYSRERARQWLQAVGFRLRRLRHQHLKAQPEEQAALVKDLTTQVADWPAHREWLCVDEATVRRHPTLTAQWCLVAEVPEVPTGDDHTKMHGYGAVAPLTGRTHYHIGHSLGKGEFATFLQQLLHYYGEKELGVIHDRAKQHKGAPVETRRSEAAERLGLKPHPGYSPELNPEERIWKWMRRVVTHNHWCESLPAEIQAIRDCFCYLAGRQEEVRQLGTIKTPEALRALL